MPELMGHEDWNALVAENLELWKGAFELDAWLHQGKDAGHWSHMAASGGARFKAANHRGYEIALVEDAKSREFSSVVLLPDLAHLIDFSSETQHIHLLGVETTRVRMNKIYTALTRAVQRLYIPEQTWLLS